MSDNVKNVDKNAEGTVVCPHCNEHVPNNVLICPICHKILPKAAAEKKKTVVQTPNKINLSSADLSNPQAIKVEEEKEKKIVTKDGMSLDDVLSRIEKLGSLFQKIASKPKAPQNNEESTTEKSASGYEIVKTKGDVVFEKENVEPTKVVTKDGTKIIDNEKAKEIKEVVNFKKMVESRFADADDDGDEPILTFEEIESAEYENLDDYKDPYYYVDTSDKEAVINAFYKSAVKVPPNALDLLKNFKKRNNGNIIRRPITNVRGFTGKNVMSKDTSVGHSSNAKDETYDEKKLKFLETTDFNLQSLEKGISGFTISSDDDNKTIERMGGDGIKSKSQKKRQKKLLKMEKKKNKPVKASKFIRPVGLIPMAIAILSLAIFLLPFVNVNYLLDGNTGYIYTANYTGLELIFESRVYLSFIPKLADVSYADVLTNLEQPISLRPLGTLIMPNIPILLLVVAGTLLISGFLFLIMLKPSKIKRRFMIIWQTLCLIVTVIPCFAVIMYYNMTVIGSYILLLVTIANYVVVLCAYKSKIKNVYKAPKANKEKQKVIKIEKVKNKKEKKTKTKKVNET